TGAPAASSPASAPAWSSSRCTGCCTSSADMVAVLALVGLTAVIALLEPAAATPWRHVYFLPVVVTAIRHGTGAGVLAALGAILLFGPVVLRDIERAGATRAVTEGFVTFALLLLAGALVGALASQARRQR